MSLSVILPTFNESGNIVRLCREIIRQVPEHVPLQILVVDDDSPDGTWRLAAEEFRDDDRVCVIRRTTDRGLARSIREGLERATGEKILIMDTDFTHDPREIPKMLHVSEVYDLVSGSRFASGGSMHDLTHYFESLLFNFFLRVILRTQIQDNLGGFWIAPRRTIMEMSLDFIFTGFGEYYFRVLHFAKKKGMSIVEIPAVYQARTAGTSKSNFGKMLLTYTFAAFQLRLKYG